MDTAMKRLLLSILIVLCAGQAWAMEKTYVILDEGDAWVYDQDNFISRIKSAGFNVAIINVHHGDGVKWLSAQIPTYYYVRGKQQPVSDPLKSFIDKSRQNGIKVWVWFCVSLNRQYPGYNLWPSIDQWFFDLRDHGYRNHVLSLIGEVLEYNPDGIFLDYMRTGVEYQDANEVVESLLTEVHTLIKSHNPKILISSFGNEQSGQGHNSPRWLDCGLTDVWITGDYEKILTNDRLEILYGATSKPNQVLMLTGNYYPSTISGRELISRLSAIGPQAMKGLYWYIDLTDEQINYMRWYAGWWK